MTDERAVKLVNLLAEYARTSGKEGATIEEVGRWTVREVAADIVDTTPSYLAHSLDETAIELAGSAA